ncbi:helix-turn-helix domain-containing protein [Saccharopolyspora rosea]|uniref:Helix-turn-helix domain-containing protein n=1 Tax=Saccharopolyspora rosea TaxID=524884 RepID=A0ABW3FPH5_9PSEU|nr:helix-turn-helix transcriptional regulator [Saccharopolyspora rosea]
MTGSRPGSPKARTLGAELRKAREDAGIGVRELARRLNRGHAWVTRTEAGTRAVTPEDVTGVVVALGVSGQERDRLVGLARESDGPDWIHTGIPGVHQELVTLIEYERTASAISEVAPLLLPGLLQTPDYARAVMAGLPAGEVETRVAMRASRRDMLISRDAPEFEAIILETALTTPILSGEPAVDQYRHLLKLAELRNVTIRVVRTTPPRWTPAHEGRFIIFEFPKASPIVHLEHIKSSAFLTSPDVVEAYRTTLGTLREMAITPAGSAEFIASCIERAEEDAR